ncbi:putative NUDIX family NTP pyrophosphohydrolase [Mucilaginibacter gracilis]|uniref:Putative NUDIX family NTP pyrophosphohydrolase n=1 Tax=Mucilaginibacter gracilis TaxID=423350 RepID=A0A495IWZ6_9SPHI|nr:NUDIX domain-containing protein [Mucilaginibacter gracilis]RKR80881.1 putative NUDIX family NTP pyrophosphohydrolase [Mucilaginibacter gracilis]
MPKQSAGILLYRTKDLLEVFLVHPGGPFFKNKDDGSWSIPKGEFLDDEDALTAAKREFEEETGLAIDGSFIKLEPEKLKSGKIIYAWALKGDIDAQGIVSNTFEIEWPPRSGKMMAFPEVERAGWFNVTEASNKLNASQFALVGQLQTLLVP